MVCLEVRVVEKSVPGAEPFGVTLAWSLDSSGTVDDSLYPSMPRFPSQQWGESEHLLYLQSPRTSLKKPPTLYKTLFVALNAQKSLR